METKLDDEVEQEFGVTPTWRIVRRRSDTPKKVYSFVKAALTWEWDKQRTSLLRQNGLHVGVNKESYKSKMQLRQIGTSWSLEMKFDDEVEQEFGVTPTWSVSRRRSDTPKKAYSYVKATLTWELNKQRTSLLRQNGFYVGVDK